MLSVLSKGELHARFMQLTSASLPEKLMQPSGRRNA